MKQKLDELKQEKAEQGDELSKVRRTLEKTQEELEKEKDKTCRNPRNSSKPPSSEGYEKPAPRSTRVSSGRPIGGQIGHPGTTLMRTGKADVTVACPLEKCKSCEHWEECVRNPEIAHKREVRSTIDIEIVTKRTDYERYDVVCPHENEKKVEKGCFPEDVKVSMQYGPTITLLILVLYTTGAVSYNRIQELIPGWRA